jgi:cytochrome c5
VIARRTAAAFILAGTLAAFGCATGGGSKAIPVSKSDTYAEQLLKRRCQSCHRTPRPDARDAADWQKALERMQRRVRLSPADWDSLATLGRVDSATPAVR